MVVIIIIYIVTVIIDIVVVVVVVVVIIGTLLTCEGGSNLGRSDRERLSRGIVYISLNKDIS